jgi:nicotinamidase-related amidase
MVNSSNQTTLLLDHQTSALVVIDAQTRLANAMPELAAQAMINNISKLLVAADQLQVPVLLTEQYPEGLGPSDPEVLRHLPKSAQLFVKTEFSCCAAPGFNSSLGFTGRKQLVLMGQEAHVCVLQTAMELRQQGFQVFVVEDALCSRNEQHKQSAIHRMRDAGVVAVSYESVLFEWLRDASHPQFKSFSALVR